MSAADPGTLTVHFPITPGEVWCGDPPDSADVVCEDGIDEWTVDGFDALSGEVLLTRTVTYRAHVDMREFVRTFEPPEQAPS